MTDNNSTEPSNRYLLFLTLGALGVVFGDIGTSPLYAIRECFSGQHAVPISEANVLGVLSLIAWALILIVSIKYLLFVMRADNRGEGGVLALMALVVPQRDLSTRDRRFILIYFGLIGAALMYGDGVITPAISVLSAVEGLTVATPLFEPYVIYITIVILSGLFLVQRRGTASIGAIFGPIMLVWFAALALLGIFKIIDSPHVLLALNPIYGINFLLDGSVHSLVILSSVFLAVTGAEALYADMGHFGRKPIRLGWFFIAFPALILNYFGQGALLLVNPEAAAHPFYLLAPGWMLYPLVALSTVATVIASQALISGAFSITRQAVQLGYLPRLQILHTSSREIGQIYIPRVNQFLWLASITLVLVFKNSSNLAAAYGLSVSTTMIITAALLNEAAVKIWGWPRLKAGLLTFIFLLVDTLFFAANSTKLLHGGWVAVLIAAGMFTIMSTWYRGREILYERLQAIGQPLDKLLANIKTGNSIRVPGTAIFMTRNTDRAPQALYHNVKHNKVVHKTAIMLMVQTDEIPSVSPEDRVSIEDLGDGFFQLNLHYGFMESPSVPYVLENLKSRFGYEVPDVTFFFGRETLIATDKPGMALWREKLFIFMSTNAVRATAFYGIPAEQVIEIGFQIEL